MNIKSRKNSLWNKSIIFIFSILFFVDKVVSTTPSLPACACTDIGKPNKYCTNSESKLSNHSQHSYANATACTDSPPPTFTAVPAIAGVEDKDYVFFDSGGLIISATNTTATPTIGYSYTATSSSFAKINVPNTGKVGYYLNKYNSNSVTKVYKYYDDAGEYLFAIVPTGENQAYISGSDLILCSGANICQLNSATSLVGRFFVNSGDPTKVISVVSATVGVETPTPTQNPYYL